MWAGWSVRCVQMRWRGDKKLLNNRNKHHFKSEHCLTDTGPKYVCVSDACGYMWTTCFETPRRLMFHEALHHFQWQREDDGGVLLGGDGVEGLEVTQLQGWRRLSNHQGGLLQSPRGIHLSLCRYHLDKENRKRGEWMNRKKILD